MALHLFDWLFGISHFGWVKTALLSGFIGMGLLSFLNPGIVEENASTWPFILSGYPILWALRAAYWSYRRNYALRVLVDAQTDTQLVSQLELEMRSIGDYNPKLYVELRDGLRCFTSTSMVSGHNLTHNIGEQHKKKQKPKDWAKGNGGDDHVITGVGAAVTLDDMLRFDQSTTVENLYNTNCAAVPNQEGVYFVRVPEGFTLHIADSTTAITEHGGVPMLYPPERLREQYLLGDRQILYVGKGRVLNTRIRQLVRYAYGKSTTHRGGRALWQIEGNKQLLVGWVVCPEAAACESNLLHQYLATYGVLPLANRQLPPRASTAMKPRG